MWERRGAYRFLEGKHEVKRPLADLGVEGRIILKRILTKSVERVRFGSG
jgi:hypothetical protein